MSEVRIIISGTRGGLDGVAQQAGVRVISGTATQFSALNTHTSHAFWPQQKRVDKAVRTQKDGWIALAQ